MTTRLLRALVVAMTLLGGLLLTVGSLGTAHALPPGGSTEPDDVFTATIERVEREPGQIGRPARYTYTVQVQEVYGESAIDSVRVRVQATTGFGECATRPETKGSTLYLWQLSRQGTRLVANGCRNVLRATEPRLTEVLDTYGEPRSPIEATPSLPKVEFPEVGYTCPETGEVLDDVEIAEKTCAETASPQAFDRAAAPGLALVIVGLLAWVLALRLGSHRRPA